MNVKLKVIIILMNKVIHEWRNELSNEGVEKGVRLGCRSINLVIKYPAPADYLAIFSDSLAIAPKQINQLKCVHQGEPPELP